MTKNNEKPILFSAPMVLAILFGQKTQTRRVVPEEVARLHKSDALLLLAKYQIGDRLWVREAWKADHIWDDWKPLEIPNDQPILYTADDDTTGCVAFEWGKTRPSIFMPRWASRITLEVTGVRVERVQDISDEDALAEGVATLPETFPLLPVRRALHYHAFAHLWDSINAKRGLGWGTNPWVWVYEFKVVEDAKKQ